MGSLGHLTFFTILLFIGASHEDDYKRWVPNTNFETAANWEGGVLPCANDHVKFPETIGTVFVQTNTTITELILPLTGELVLGDYVSLSFPLTPSYTPGCPTDREVKFTRTEPKSWFNPDDWCVTAAEGGDCRADQPALLSSEQVPCNSDTVSFPMSSSFLVSIDSGTDIYAGALIVAGKGYSTSTFRTFLGSEEGRRQFVREGGALTTVTLTGNKCTDKSGCACGNDRGTILEKICATTSAQCAATLDCIKPISAMGECCDLCGAVMKMDIGSGFDKKKAENLILSRYVHAEDKYKNVKPVVSKTSLGQIQVMLTDGGNGDTAAEVANSLKKDFSEDSTFDVKKISVDFSESSKPTPSGQTGGLDGGGIAGIVLAIIAVAAIIAVCAFFIIGKRRPPSIPIDLNFDRVKATFKNLGKESGPADLELGTVSFRNSPGTEDILYGFDNPMYGEAGAVKDLSTGAKAASPAPVTLEATSGAGFTNPMYGSTPIQVDFQNLGESKPEKKAKSGKKGSGKAGDQLTFPDDTASGFSNPLYPTPIQDLQSGNPSVMSGQSNLKVVSGRNEGPSVRARPVDTSDSAVLVLNPVFSTDGLEQDSII